MENTLNPNETKGYEVKGYLLRGTDGSLFFRIYEEDRSKYKDYEIFHHDLQIQITDNYSSFYLYDDKTKKERGFDGYIDYPSRLGKKKECDVLPPSEATDDEAEKPSNQASSAA